MPYLERTPEVDLWLTALASEEFRDKQIYGVMWRKDERRGECFCALGLCCFINGHPTQDAWTYVEELIGKDMLNTVLQWNDAKELTFPEIARKLVECLPEGQRKGLMVDLLAGPLDLPSAMDKTVRDMLIDAELATSVEFTADGKLKE